VQTCGACGLVYSYARSFCPTCWSTDVSWTRASGRGQLYTWSVVRQNDIPAFVDLVPYVAAMVDLVEGPRLATLIVCCEPESLVVGMPVQVEFAVRSEAISLPVFRPAEPAF